MKTFTGKSVTIHHRGDYSGSALLTSKEVTLEVDPDDLFAFVADALRIKKLVDAEAATDEELLGFNWREVRG